MAITTLLGMLKMGKAIALEPAQITIETKIYIVTDGAFKLEGSSVSNTKPNKAWPNLVISTATGVDEAKLKLNKGLKVVSAPLIRTLNGMQAQMTTNLLSDNGKSEATRLSFTPVFRSDEMFDLSLTFSMEREAKPAETWKIEQKPRLHPEQTYAIYVSSPTRRNLFVVKTYLHHG